MAGREERFPPPQLRGNAQPPRGAAQGLPSSLRGQNHDPRYQQPLPPPRQGFAGVNSDGGQVPIDAPKGLFLIFDEWTAAPVDNFKLEEAWVRVSGCPYKLRCDYLALFAVGSLIGKALEIDMDFTRKHSVVRMYVQVTSIDQIPGGTDHTYDGAGYGITFEVEGYNPPVLPDVHMQEANDDAEDKGQGEGKHESNLDNKKEMKNSEKPPSKSSVTIDQTQTPKHNTVVTVGSIVLETPTCIAASEGNLKVFVPRRLWGDRAEEDEGLPSPLAFSAPARFDRPQQAVSQLFWCDWKNY
ncbi:hypothetical protein ACQ4PT_055569 [Festuca glaucescens]